MEREDYINLLVLGYLDNRKFYQSHVLRLMRRAKNDFFIGNYEFLTRSIDLIEECIHKAKEDRANLVKEIEPKIKAFKIKDGKGSLSFDEKNYYEVLKESFDSEAVFFIADGTLAPGNNSVNIQELLEVKSVLESLFREVHGIIEKNDLNDNQYLNLVTYNSAVFKNELAFKLFTLYIKDFKGNKSEQAIFSFLYDAMTRLKLIHCTAPNFVKELRKFEVDIERIDSKQCYTESNNKTPAFKYMFKDIFGILPDFLSV